jgi:hypothetical protein
MQKYDESQHHHPRSEPVAVAMLQHTGNGGGDSGSTQLNLAVYLHAQIVREDWPAVC